MGLPANPIKRSLYTHSTGFLASLSSIILSMYQATLDFVIEGDDHLRILRARKQNFIVAVWHTFVDAAVFSLHSRGLCIYSDHPRTRAYEESWTHFFREIGIKTIRAQGFEVLDASLGKQSKGIIDFIKIIRNGTPALVAPDGPHGPNYESKPGVLYMAHKSNSVVLPIGVGFSRRVVGPNWDDFALPLPFSRVALTIGPPIVPDGDDMDDEGMQRQARGLEYELDRLCFRANDILFGTQESEKFIESVRLARESRLS